MGELQAHVNMKKAMKEMDTGGGMVSWDEVVYGSRSCSIVKLCKLQQQGMQQ